MSHILPHHRILTLTTNSIPHPQSRLLQHTFKHSSAPRIIRPKQRYFCTERHGWSGIGRDFGAGMRRFEDSGLLRRHFSTGVERNEAANATEGSKTSTETSTNSSKESNNASPNAAQEYLLYTSPPFPHYSRILSYALFKLLVNCTVSLVGTVSSLFIGGNPLTIVMAGAPAFWIWRGQRQVMALLKEVKKIYYVGPVRTTLEFDPQNPTLTPTLKHHMDMENGRLKIVLFRQGRSEEEPEGRVEWINLKDTKQLSTLHMSPNKNHTLVPYQQTWQWGSTPYRVDSHGVVHNETPLKLDLNRDIFLSPKSQVAGGEVFRIQRDSMDRYGFVRVAPVKQLEKLTDWKAKWHVIVDNEIHLLLTKPFDTYFAVDAFCHRGHAMSAAKVEVQYNRGEDKSRSGSSKEKVRVLKCTQCLKDHKKDKSIPLPSVPLIRANSLPVREIDGWICVRVDSIYKDVNGGREFLEHCMRERMTLEELLSFYAVYG